MNVMLARRMKEGADDRDDQPEEVHEEAVIDGGVGLVVLAEGDGALDEIVPGEGAYHSRPEDGEDDFGDGQSLHGEDG